ncbi:MAG: trypsin-like serine peptidase [Chloroflexota bacterium]
MLKRLAIMLSLLFSVVAPSFLVDRAATLGAPQRATIPTKHLEVFGQPESQQTPVTVGEVENTALRIDHLKENSVQTIRYPNAAYIKVHFATLNLLPGDFVTVSNPAGTEVYTYPGSAFTSDGEDGFWALSVTGDTAVIQLSSQVTQDESQDNTMQTSVVFIDKFTRGYPLDEIRNRLELTESTCGTNQRTDVVCYQGTHPTEYDKANAVARLLLNNGAALCTGWRLGEYNHMLTNEHCITDQAGVNAAEAWFNYQNLACGVTGQGTVTKVTGHTFLKDDADYDFSLFSVNDFDKLASFGYLELDARVPVLGEEIYIPQHGAGNPKEFGIESDMDTGNVCRIDDAVAYGWIADSDTGYYCDTIGGSSGSPVLARSSHQVIALHHFGGCLNQGVRIDKIWPLIQTPLALPDPAILSAPEGSIGAAATPTYSWNEAGQATWYYLWVNDSDGNAQVKQWYTSSSICDAGNCFVTPDVELKNGTYTWWVRTWNSTGYGPWSNAMNFSVSFAPPGIPTLLTPTGDIGDEYYPTYTWNKVTEAGAESIATWYYLWVNGPSGNVFKQWYRAIDICNGTTCAAKPGTPLGGGAHTWWVQAWNPGGYGAWSSPMNFSTEIPTVPETPVLIAPTGNVSDTTPTYIWNEVTESNTESAATWYYLWVNGPTGNVIKQWYKAVDVCSEGTCSVTPSTMLSSGAHTWWVRAWNQAGYSPWSSEMDFDVNP